MICSDWPCNLRDIAAVGGGSGRVLVATSIDDVICAPPNARYVAREIPVAMLYESKQLCVVYTFPSPCNFFIQN